MRECLPSELFNRVPYPYSTVDEAATGLERIYEEIAYKLPNVDDTLAKREVWHALCDFCARTGTLIERVAVTAIEQEDEGTGVLVPRGQEEGDDTVRLVNQIQVPQLFGRFAYLVGVVADGEGVAPSPANFTLNNGSGGAAGNIYVVLTQPAYTATVLACTMPQFSDRRQDNATAWAPTVPKYMIDRYGEAIAHGALTRIYAMRGAMTLARAHATAYNNDLTRHSIGHITSGMRRRVALDIEDMLVVATNGGNQN